MFTRINMWWLERKLRKQQKEFQEIHRTLDRPDIKKRLAEVAYGSVDRVPLEQVAREIFERNYAIWITSRYFHLQERITGVQASLLLRGITS